jgi:hypothetical protein
VHLGHRVHFDPADGAAAENGSDDELLFAPFGLLADCLKNGPVAREDILRRQWGFGRVLVGARARQAQPDARKSALLALDGETVYGVTEDYEFDWDQGRIWARTLAIHGTAREGGQRWQVEADPSLLMRALVSTADSLLLGVQRSPEDVGELWVVSKADGHTLAQILLDGVPRWDGLATTSGKVFVATEDGQVICLGER